MRIALVVNEVVIFQLALSLFDSTGRVEPDDGEDIFDVQDGVSGPVTPRFRFGFVPTDVPDIDEDDDLEGGQVRDVPRLRAPRRGKLHLRTDLR